MRTTVDIYAAQEDKEKIDSKIATARGGKNLWREIILEFMALFNIALSENTYVLPVLLHGSEMWDMTVT